MVDVVVVVVVERAYPSPGSVRAGVRSFDHLLLEALFTHGSRLSLFFFLWQVLQGRARLQRDEAVRRLRRKLRGPLPRQPGRGREVQGRRVPDPGRHGRARRQGHGRPEVGNGWVAFV